MASYNRLGSFFLAEVLASFPGGEVVRAVSASGGSFERHHLLRTFSEDLLEAGLGSRWGEAQRQANQLAGVRGVGGGYRFESGKPACVVCDYLPGRSLAAMLEKTRTEQVPLGVDHALTVLQGLSQAIIQMHDKNIHHGTLSPHSIWIGYEGLACILDAPFAAVVQGLLPKAPALQAALAPYRAGSGNAFQQDLFALGAMFYELLTLDKLPASAGIPAALAGATLKAAQEEGPLPPEVLDLLRRLLMVEQPFATAAEFNATLERVLYDGDYSPTTFNLAFLMHTLFRDESERDAQAMKADQGAHFAAPQAPAAAAAAAAPGKPSGGRGLNLILAGGVVVALGAVGAMFYVNQRSNRQRDMEQASMQAKLAAFQKAKEEADAKEAEIAKQQEAQKALEDMFGQQAETAATAEARAAAKRDLEAAKAKAKELARQRAEVQKERQRLIFTAPAGPAPTLAPREQPAPAPAPAGDAGPAVAQKSPAQAPLGLNKDTLPAALQQASSIRVSVNVFVDPSGRPLKVVIKKGVEGNFGYNDAAERAALASTYTAGSKAGKPVSGWVSLDYDFAKPK